MTWHNAASMYVCMYVCMYVYKSSALRNPFLRYMTRTNWVDPLTSSLFPRCLRININSQSQLAESVRTAAAQATIGSVARSGAGDALRAGFYRNYGTPLVTRINKEEVYYWPDESDQVIKRALALVGRRVSVMLSGTTDDSTGEFSPSITFCVTNRMAQVPRMTSLLWYSSWRV
jgi:hypothetical protein